MYSVYRKQTHKFNKKSKNPILSNEEKKHFGSRDCSRFSLVYYKKNYCQQAKKF